MEYEYNMLTTAFRLPTGIGAAQLDDINQALAPQFGRLAQRLGDAHPTLPGNGWEAVSHAVTPVGQFLVTTILFRRPK